LKFILYYSKFGRYYFLCTLSGSSNPIIFLFKLVALKIIIYNCVIDMIKYVPKYKGGYIGLMKKYDIYIY